MAWECEIGKEVKLGREHHFKSKMCYTEAK